MALFSARRRQWCLPAATAPLTEVDPKPPNVQRASTRESAKRKRWQVRATQWNPPTGAQHPVLGLGLCRDFISYGRTSCFRQPAIQATRGRGDVRGCIRRASRTVSGKWFAQAHRHRFRPVRTGCLIQDSQKAHV